MNRYGRRWRERTRAAILYRDRRQCQIRGPGCTVYATTVDHVRPLVSGGSMHDPANLRAACHHCNTSAGATLGNARRGPVRAAPVARGERRVWSGAIEL